MTRVCIVGLEGKPRPGEYEYLFLDPVPVAGDILHIRLHGREASFEVVKRHFGIELLPDGHAHELDMIYLHVRESKLPNPANIAPIPR